MFSVQVVQSKNNESNWKKKRKKKQQIFIINKKKMWACQESNGGHVFLKQMVVFGFYWTKTNLGFSSDIILFVKNSIDFLFCSKPKAHNLTPKVKRNMEALGWDTTTLKLS